MRERGWGDRGEGTSFALINRYVNVSCTICVDERKKEKKK